jgi:hypothetical protein
METSSRTHSISPDPWDLKVLSDELNALNVTVSNPDRPTVPHWPLQRVDEGCPQDVTLNSSQVAPSHRPVARQKEPLTAVQLVPEVRTRLAKEVSYTIRAPPLEEDRQFAK